jgi:geranylgeranyl diphosphate synthase type I
MYGSLGGKDINNALKLLVSLEVFHSFELMHDDIIDKGTLRHGITTSHIYITNKLKKEKRSGDLIYIGNSQAILLGDILFSWAMESLNTNTDFNPKIINKVIKLFYQMADEVHIGQMIDIDLTTRKKVSKEFIDEKIRLKTAGYSFIKPFQIGAALAGRETSEVEKFCKEFGLKMGIAFQTQDDLLDITSTDEKLQKTTSSDKLQHQHTYFTHFKSLNIGKEIIETNFNEAKDLVKNLPVNQEAKKKFFDLIEIIQTRTF